MNKLIEMQECIDVIDISLGDSEDNIKSNISYIIIYRLRKQYGCDYWLQVRGSFEQIYESRLLSSKEVDYDLKQMLWDFNIMFIENTMVKIDNRENRRHKLLILSEWTSVDDVRMESEKSLQSENGLAITDVIVENLHDNNKCDEITQLLNNSHKLSVQLWYIKNNVDFYASFSNKVDAYASMFSEEDIIDITADIMDMIGGVDLPYDIVDKLVEYGKSLYESGVKCLTYRESYNNNILESNMHCNVVSAFLVYMSENYNMAINTMNDVSFCDMYRIYQSCCYGTADDIFSRYNMYYPVMLYVNGENRNFVYIRSIDMLYDFVYVRMSELERMIVGDDSVKMRHYSQPISRKYGRSGYIHINNKMSLDERLTQLQESEFVDHITSDEDDADILSIYDVFSDEEKINKIVQSFNKYNVTHSESKIYKYITVRDLMCRRIVEDGEEYIQIGYITSRDDRVYGNRINQKITISLINPDIPSAAIIQCGYFVLPPESGQALYPVRYVYDLQEKAPKSLLNLIDDTYSYDNDIFDMSTDEDGNHIVGTRGEKFLYYVCSRYMNPDSENRLGETLTVDRVVYKASLYKPVYTANNVIKELSKYFDESNLIKAGLIDMFGNINSEFISSKNDKSFLNIKNELWGIMQVED